MHIIWRQIISSSFFENLLVLVWVKRVFFNYTLIMWCLIDRKFDLLSTSAAYEHLCYSMKTSIRIESVYIDSPLCFLVWFKWLIFSQYLNTNELLTNNIRLKAWNQVSYFLQISIFKYKVGKNWYKNWSLDFFKTKWGIKYFFQKWVTFNFKECNFLIFYLSWKQLGLKR